MPTCACIHSGMLSWLTYHSPLSMSPARHYSSSGGGGSGRERQRALSATLGYQRIGLATEHSAGARRSDRVNAPAPASAPPPAVIGLIEDDDDRGKVRIHKIAQICVCKSALSRSISRCVSYHARTLKASLHTVHRQKARGGIRCGRAAGTNSNRPWGQPTGWWWVLRCRGGGEMAACVGWRTGGRMDGRALGRAPRHNRGAHRRRCPPSTWCPPKTTRAHARAGGSCGGSPSRSSAAEMGWEIDRPSKGQGVRLKKPAKKHTNTGRGRIVGEGRRHGKTWEILILPQIRKHTRLKRDSCVVWRWPWGAGAKSSDGGRLRSV